MTLVTVPGSADELDWPTWGLPLTNAVNDHDTRIASLEAQATYGVALLSTSVGSNGTTTSSSYSDVPGTSTATLVKAMTTTQLLLDFSGGFFVQTVNNTECMFGLRINGVDYDVARFMAAPQLTSFPAVGYGVIAASVVPAGTYTVQARWKRPTGTGTVSRDVTTPIAFRVLEKL